MYAAAAVRDGRLGLPWGTIIGTATGAAVDLIRGGGASNWVEHYSKTWKGRPCPGAPSASQAAAAARNAPASLKNDFVAALAAANKGFAPSVAELTDASRAHLWVNAAMGGDDCQATSAAGQKITGIFQGMMAFASIATFPTNAGPTGGGAGSQGSTTRPPPSTDPSIFIPHRPPIDDYVPPKPPAVEAKASDNVPVPQVPADLVPFTQGFLEDLKRIALESGKQAAERVAEEAIAKVPDQYKQRAADVVRPHLVDQYRTQAIGGLQANLPLLIGGGLVLAVLMGSGGARRRR